MMQIDSDFLIAKISDFGVSKLIQSTIGATTTNQGYSPAYSSLEVLEQSSKLSEKADIYSFGILLYSLDIETSNF